MKHPLDSQERLAASIIRAVQTELPATEASPELVRSVENTLLHEARESEISLARGRLFALGGFLLFCVLAEARPPLVGLTAFPLSATLATLGALAIATVFYATLRGGYYRAWLRRGVPVADAGIVIILFLLVQHYIPAREEVPEGLFIVTAGACSLIAFSGSLRLSRSAALFTTFVAGAAALIIALIGHLHTIETIFVVAVVWSTGVLSSRLTKMIRRVVTEEVVRGRLANLYTDAREATNAREEVLKIVSHDLRNPISTIGMAAEMMMEQPLTEEQRIKNLGMIRRAAERMNRLIHDLLDVAKLEAGRIAIATALTSTKILLDDAAELLTPLANEAGISLVAKPDADLPDVWVDRDRMLQVFSNLGGNAIKFTPSGGQITLLASRQGDSLRFCVCDTGPGIPQDKLSEIFAPFWQAERSDNRGLGLGLSIARSIIEAHGGRIGVESQPGAGCQFWFTIPVTPASS